MTGKRPALSPNEMRVLDLLNRGKTRREIAREFKEGGISTETVRDYIDQIKAELGVPSGEGFVYTARRAYELGVLKGPSPLLKAAAKRQRQKKKS